MGNPYTSILWLNLSLPLEKSRFFGGISWAAAEGTCPYKAKNTLYGRDSAPRGLAQNSQLDQNTEALGYRWHAVSFAPPYCKTVPRRLQNSQKCPKWLSDAAKRILSPNKYFQNMLSVLPYKNMYYVCLGQRLFWSLVMRSRGQFLKAPAISLSASWRFGSEA